MQDYAGKTVAITGGATGIGFALAKRFGAEGANLVIGEPRTHRLAEAEAALSELGYTVAVKELDVTDPASVEAFAAFTWDRFSGCHLLINNAGVGGPRGRITKIETQDVRDLFDVNFFGVWHGAASFGRRMVEQGQPAAIYNVGSENSFFNAMPKMAAYIASKHAVRGLTEALREEFPDFMTIGLICPGFVSTELTPPPFGALGMDADEYAPIVVEQIKAGAFYVVSHACNMDRIQPVHDEIEAAYARYAPRYEGDQKYDVRRLVESVARNRDA